MDIPLLGIYDLGYIFMVSTKVVLVTVTSGCVARKFSIVIRISGDLVLWFVPVLGG